MDRFGGLLSHLERHADTFSVEALTSVIPSSLVATSIRDCGASSLRRRSLPAELTLWLTVAAGLWRSRGFRNVLAGLGKGLCRNLAWMGGRAPTSAAVTRARRRLGWTPLRTLFERLTAPLRAQNALRLGWRGMALLAIDGTILRMPDTAQNRSHFGAHRTCGKPTAFPLARLLVVMCAVSHVVLAAALGTARTSERALLPSLLKDVPQNSLFLLDRGFFGRPLLVDLGRAGHHVVMRARRGTRLRRRRRRGSRDWLGELEISPRLRRVRPDLPERFVVRMVTYQVPGFRSVQLLTTLTDPDAFPAQEIAQLYRQRWEVEIGFDEIKTHLLGEHVALRSKSPELVTQEVYALLIAFNAVRVLMAQAAAVTQQDPRRISFSDALDRLRDLTVRMACAGTLRLPEIFRQFLEDLASCLLPPRRSRRRYPRTVKTLPNYYPVRRRPRAA